MTAGQNDLARLLLANGANVNVKDGSERTLLQLAISRQLGVPRHSWVTGTMKESTLDYPAIIKLLREYRARE